MARNGPNAIMLFRLFFPKIIAKIPYKLPIIYDTKNATIPPIVPSVNPIMIARNKSPGPIQIGISSSSSSGVSNFFAKIFFTKSYNGTNGKMKYKPKISPIFLNSFCFKKYALAGMRICKNKNEYSRILAKILSEKYS